MGPRVGPTMGTQKSDGGPRGQMISGQNSRQMQSQMTSQQKLSAGPGQQTSNQPHISDDKDNLSIYIKTLLFQIF